MRILLIHNSYRQRGGEDEVFWAEAALLRGAGHSVVEYTRTNDDIVANGIIARAQLAANTVWARAEAYELRQTIERVDPDVVHFHNTFPRISPAAYYACHDARVPVIQTLQNYRLRCPSANHFRNGRVCEECSTHGLLKSVRYGCYRGSHSATAAVATMLAVHRALGTWRDQVEAYIAPSEFARRTFVDATLPAEKVVVKPNFVDPDPGVRESPGTGAAFVGRFWPEKGVRTMLLAWRRLTQPVILEILGDGPQRPELEALSAGTSGICFRGLVPRPVALATMKKASFLVFPSEWYEGMPMTILEAFACGVPVIASRLGTMAEIVEDHRTGLHFTAGDADDLAAKVEWAVHHPGEMARMGRAARDEFEAKYTAKRNLTMLLSIYNQARAAATRRDHAGARSALAQSVPLETTISQQK